MFFGAAVYLNDVDEGGGTRFPKLNVVRCLPQRTLLVSSITFMYAFIHYFFLLTICFAGADRPAQARPSPHLAFGSE